MYNECAKHIHLPNFANIHPGLLNTMLVCLPLAAFQIWAVCAAVILGLHSNSVAVGLIYFLVMSLFFQIKPQSLDSGFRIAGVLGVLFAGGLSSAAVFLFVQNPIAYYFGYLMTGFFLVRFKRSYQTTRSQNSDRFIDDLFLITFGPFIWLVAPFVLAAMRCNSRVALLVDRLLSV